jgi:hypothetical protein
MFTRHATFRSPNLVGLDLRRVAPYQLETKHANDNLRAVRRPASQRRSPPPRLACRWVLVDESRLECCWQVENPSEGTGIERPDGRRVTQNLSRWPPTVVLCRAFATGSGQR